MAVTACGVFFFVQLTIQLEFYYTSPFFLLANRIVISEIFCQTQASQSQENEGKKSLILDYLV